MVKAIRVGSAHSWAKRLKLRLRQRQRGPGQTRRITCATIRSVTGCANARQRLVKRQAVRLGSIDIPANASHMALA